ncbi:MAG TPA: methyltransferase [Cyclobacteriaceae bacterium]|nr:methyltransferase [Cyclobacteriaceae bacterium]
METSFEFKHFAIEHYRATMKVGTDAVLLGAWVDVGNAKAILDVGTGSGVIALMMAQRSGVASHIDAVEPHGASAMQAIENVNKSPWPEKVQVHPTSIQKFQSEVLYDLIVSNPPYFNNSLLPPTQDRQVARHTETLTFDDLLVAVKRLLDPNGAFAVVLPVNEGNLFREQAGQYGLSCHRSMAFYSRKEKQQERWLMEFSFAGKQKEVNSEKVILYEDGDQWTERYAALMREFYLR